MKDFVTGNHDHDTWWMLIKLSERSDQTSHVFWVTSMMVNVESVTKVQSMREKQCVLVALRSQVNPPWPSTEVTLIHISVNVAFILYKMDIWHVKDSIWCWWPNLEWKSSACITHTTYSKQLNILLCVIPSQSVCFTTQPTPPSCHSTSWNETFNISSIGQC